MWGLGTPLKAAVPQAHRGLHGTWSRGGQQVFLSLVTALGKTCIGDQHHLGRKRPHPPQPMGTALRVGQGAWGRVASRHVQPCCLLFLGQLFLQQLQGCSGWRGSSLAGGWRASLPGSCLLLPPSGSDIIPHSEEEPEEWSADSGKQGEGWSGRGSCRSEVAGAVVCHDS